MTKAVRIIKKAVPSAGVLAAAFLTAVAAGADDCIRVSSYDMLCLIGVDKANYPLNGRYCLVDSIDASKSRGGFVPIGKASEPFTGQFYGYDAETNMPATRVVRGLYINRPNDGNVGLFGYVGAGAVIKNIGVAGAEVTGSYAVGALAGTNNGGITGCYSTGAVRAGRDESNAGGLAGVNGGTIWKSYSAAAVSGKSNVGGLVGFLTTTAKGEITESYAVGNVEGANNSGGLVGYIFGGNIDMCFSAGAVTGRGTMGGLVGEDFARVNTAYNVRGKSGSGYVKRAEIENSYWDKNTSTQAASPAGGTGRNTAEMMNGVLFRGWDFTNTWTIINGTYYPQLRATPVYTITYIAGDNGKLRLKGIDRLADTCRMSVSEGAKTLEITAVPNEHCTFVEWSDYNPNAARSDVATKDMTVTAIFAAPATPYYTFFYKAGNGGELRVGGVSGPISVYSGGSFASGAKGPVVAAVPDIGYSFLRWDDNNTKIIRSDNAVKDVNVEAVFANDTRQVKEISSFNEILKIGKDSDYPITGAYELTGNINADEDEVTVAAVAEFKGVFRGNGHSITGLKIAGTSNNVGLFGRAESAIITGVFIVNADVSSAGNNVGALVGICVNTIIDSCGSSGSVSGTSGVGGLVGRSSGSLISRSRSSAAVVGTVRGAGGLAGISAGSLVTNCNVTGSASGSNAAGGLIGVVDSGGAVQVSYSTGAASGSDSVGGLAGKVAGGVIFQCYSTGKVEGGQAAGGLVGALDGGMVSASYWDVTTSTLSMSAGGAGKTTTDMKAKATYDEWDFTPEYGVWDIAAGYPYLREFEPVAGGGSPKSKQAMANGGAGKRLATVRGGAMAVNVPNGAVWQIRLVDMRGKTVARYSAKNGSRLPLGKIPPGRYAVEAREGGKRVGVSALLLK